MAWEVLRGFGVPEGVSKRVSERTPCAGELVTACASQRSPGSLSAILSELLRECNSPLRAAGPVSPNHVASRNSLGGHGQ